MPSIRTHAVLTAERRKRAGVHMVGARVCELVHEHPVISHRIHISDNIRESVQEGPACP